MRQFRTIDTPRKKPMYCRVSPPFFHSITSPPPPQNTDAKLGASVSCLKTKRGMITEDRCGKICNDFIHFHYKYLIFITSIITELKKIICFYQQIKENNISTIKVVFKIILILNIIQILILIVILIIMIIISTNSVIPNQKTEGSMIYRDSSFQTYFLTRQLV